MTTALSDATVGLIRYGEVGEHLAATFQRAGSTLIVVNRSPADLREQLADEPYTIAESPSDQLGGAISWCQSFGSRLPSPWPKPQRRGSTTELGISISTRYRHL